MNSITESPQYIADMLVEADPNAPPLLFYMSFADGSLPTGTQFLGGLFIVAKSLSGALTLSHERKLNPGGEVKVLQLDRVALPNLNDKWMNRLLSKAELDELDAEMKKPQ